MKRKIKYRGTRVRTHTHTHTFCLVACRYGQVQGRIFTQNLNFRYDGVASCCSDIVAWRGVRIETLGTHAMARKHSMANDTKEMRQLSALARKQEQSQSRAIWKCKYNHSIPQEPSSPDTRYGPLRANCRHLFLCWEPRKDGEGRAHTEPGKEGGNNYL